MIKHTGDLPYQCEHCPQKFSKSSSRKYHTERVHLKLRPFVCKECNKSFFWKKNLKRHLQIHERDRVK